MGLVGHGAVARFAAAEYRRLPDVTITAVAGKHVLVEKPLATTLADAEELRTVQRYQGDERSHARLIGLRWLPP